MEWQYGLLESQTIKLFHVSCTTRRNNYWVLSQPLSIPRRTTAWQRSSRLFWVSCKPFLTPFRGFHLIVVLFHFKRHRHPPSGFGKSSWLPLLGRGVVPPFIQEQIITHNHFIKNLTYWHLRHNLVEPVCKVLLSNRLGSSHETPNSFFFDVKHNILSEAFASLLLFVIILSICRMTFVQSRCVLEFSYFLPQQQDRRKHAL